MKRNEHSHLPEKYQPSGYHNMTLTRLTDHKRKCDEPDVVVSKKIKH